MQKSPDIGAFDFYMTWEYNFSSFKEVLMRLLKSYTASVRQWDNQCCGDMSAQRACVRWFAIGLLFFAVTALVYKMLLATPSQPTRAGSIAGLAVTVTLALFGAACFWRALGAIYRDLFPMQMDVSEHADS